MNLQFREQASLPRLSWCAAAISGSGVVDVSHGESVYRGSDFFAEGAWNGTLDGASLVEASVCAGSGAVASAGGVTFVTTTDTMARLHSIRVGKTVWISNSLSILLCASGARVDPSYLFYEDDFSAIVRGLPQRRRSIPIADGNRVSLFWHCNLTLRDDLTFHIQQKQTPAHFPDFDAYERFLSATLVALDANANDPARSVVYRPIVSVSRGYDSPTCAVLSRTIGCDEAVTVRDPASSTPDEDDGSDIARALGMRVTVISREQYKATGGEAEFLAVGTGGEDVFIEPLSSVLRDRMLITGFHGDKVWDRHAKATTRIVRGDPSGGDLEEFRQRVGFIHVAVPFFGCIRHPEIRAISASSAMDPWSIGPDYDRPICRRIVESAGINRRAFGQRKQVMSRAFLSASNAIWYFGEASLADFRAYVSTRAEIEASLKSRLLQAIARSGIWLGTRLSGISYRISRVPIKLVSRLGRYYAPFDERRLLFQWGLDRQIAKWRASESQAPTH